MNYYEAMKFLKTPKTFDGKLDLENIGYLLDILGNPQRKVKAIHVAGTNGKGSTCAFLNNILIEAGYKTGLYVSPSLEEINDRISVNNVHISDEDFCELATKVGWAIDIMVSQGHYQPTEFEVITAIAFLYFEKQAVDYLVLEVGLGGRLDATNVCVPVVTVITSISLDHTEYLGDTLAKIAIEKAGIIKHGVPVILYEQESEVMEAVTSIARKKEGKLYLNSDIQGSVTEVGIEGQLLELRINGKYMQLKSKLVGKHQENNLKTALKTLEVLMEVEGIKVAEDALSKGVENTRWSGRFEVISYTPTIILDGAHNLDGAKVLIKTLEAIGENKTKTLIFGMLSDKDIQGVVKILGPMFSKVIITMPNSPRAETLDKILDIFSEYKVESIVETDVAQAVSIGLNSTTDMVVIAGSLYLIGDVRKILKEKEIIK